MSNAHFYPLTKMNFVVHVDQATSVAAFNEVSGIETSVDVIEFRQGNASSLAPVKIPGLVKHGNITLKMGYVRAQSFKDWVVRWTKETRPAEAKKSTISIEMIDISDSSPSSVGQTASGTGVTWVLSNAWVTKYTGPDLNSTTSEVAIESIEIAYEHLTIPN